MRARARDRAVYRRSHPVLFAALSLTRRAPTVRWGRTLVVHGTAAYRDALTGLDLDRTAPGTTGGIVRSLTDADGVLFDEVGAGHRHARRAVADPLGAAGVDRLRPVWQAVLADATRPGGGEVDVVALARTVAGATTAALLGLDVAPRVLADAASRAATTAARVHLPGPRWRPAARLALARAAAADLVDLAGGARGAVLAIAAVTTTVAALPRAVAWCADDGLWPRAADPAVRPVLVDELLRVLAPAPLLPRVAAAPGRVGRHPVRAGDRLVLVGRHAARAHDRAPDPADPAPAQVAQLVFGAGPHACPGARLARRQLADILAAFAPYRPVVVRARPDRHAALPSWAVLTVRPTCGPATGGPATCD